MKFGCCVSMSPAQGDPAGISNLEIVAQAGYDYVELPVAEIVLLDDKQFDALVNRLDTIGLRCESCNNFFPKHLRLTGAERSEEKIRAYLAAALPRIKRLGAESVVFGSAGAKNVPEGFPMERAWEQIEDDLRIISDMLLKVDPSLRVAIEPICKRESNILFTYGEGAALAKRVGRKNIRCLADFYHMYVEEEPVSALVADGDLLQHIHISNPQGRIYPKDDDGADYAALFDALKHAGYDLRVSVEAYTTDMFEDSVAALACLRKYI